MGKKHSRQSLEHSFFHLLSLAVQGTCMRRLKMQRRMSESTAVLTCLYLYMQTLLARDKNELMRGQTSQNRHDLLARVFRLKFKKLMEFANKWCDLWHNTLSQVLHRVAKAGPPRSHIWCGLKRNFTLLMSTLSLVQRYPTPKKTRCSTTTSRST